MLPLRQLSDPILHTPVPVTDIVREQEKIASQVKLMEQYLQTSGFIGLAANQCQEFESPCRMMIIGTNSEEFRALAEKRYPNQIIPHQTLMINPKILRLIGEPHYPETGEGCGSVDSTLRGKVLRHGSVEVEYNDINGVVHREIYHQLAAYVSQHELDHLDGIVYLQKIISEMTEVQLNDIITSCRYLLETQQYRVNTPWDKTKRAVAFDRDDLGNLVIHENLLQDGLRSCLASTLEGIVAVTQKRLQR